MLLRYTTIEVCKIGGVGGRRTAPARTLNLTQVRDMARKNSNNDRALQLYRECLAKLA